MEESVEDHGLPLERTDLAGQGSGRLLEPHVPSRLTSKITTYGWSAKDDVDSYATTG